MEAAGSGYLCRMSNIDHNEDAMETLHQDLAENLAIADRELRDQALIGKPVDEIMPLAADALAVADVTLPEDKLRQYATTVSEGKPYEFEVE